MSGDMNLKLRVWRQDGPNAKGRIQEYEAKNINPNKSFLEMLDVVNEDLILREKNRLLSITIAERICGMCSLVIDGEPHGPERGTTTCQLHMRHFSDGDTITIEPFRATAFPVLKDLMIDRSAFDRITQAGGYVSVRTGAGRDANALPIAKEKSDRAFDAATCIGCGACVAACKNASAMLFVGAKVTHLGLLPQGQPEREARVLNMVGQMDQEGFGSCTNQYECEAACPKEISRNVISQMNGDYLKASVRNRG